MGTVPGFQEIEIEPLSGEEICVQQGEEKVRFPVDRAQIVIAQIRVAVKAAEKIAKAAPQPAAE